MAPSIASVFAHAIVFVEASLFVPLLHHQCQQRCFVRSTFCVKRSSTPPHLLHQYIVCLQGPHQRLPVACTLHPIEIKDSTFVLFFLSLLNTFGSKCVSPVASECLRSGPPALGSTQLLAHQEININISIISISNVSTKINIKISKSASSSVP